ncbi:MAG: undecaprenyl-diphosphate phosphatase [Clostridiales bacterium]|nr:undecaprenyl-diphosphate phosphatase [Clostridiales bacterium]
MNIWLALLLGLVQGVCEFLPVSSSGHLLLIQKLTGADPNQGGAFFTVMLHMATLAAVCIVYRKTLWALIRRPFQKTVGLLILATVPTVIVALLLKQFFSSFYDKLESGAFLGICFSITSALLLCCDGVMARAKSKREMKEMTVRDALVIGGMQAVGILPGVSRSGATISGAVFSGLDRKAAADFSFLLSIPAILGGAVLEGKDALSGGGLGVGFLPLLVGMAAAGVTGYFAIRLLIKLITQKKLWGFAVYTAVLGVAVVVLQFLGKI